MKKFAQILIFLFSMAAAYGQEPAITMTTSKAVGEKISFGLSADTINTVIQIDFGDGIKVDKTIGTQTIGISGAIEASQTIRIYGSGINELYCTNMQLTTLDISNNKDMVWLTCDGNQLTTLNLAYNTALAYFYCNNNQLISLDLSKNLALKAFWCVNNQLTTLDLSNNIHLKSLNCSNNQLTSFYAGNVESINCSNNQLTTLNVNNIANLMTLYCFNNQLTFATLPHPKDSWMVYKYSPQKPIFIGNEVKVGDDIDLGSQLTVNGNTTLYTWKSKDGTILTEGIDYTISNGITAFLKAPGDSVYCEMTNATFPGFTGNNVLKTWLIKVHPATASSEPGIPGNGVYIYPNPARNVINVDVTGMQNAELSIYNSLGMLMLQQSTGNGKAQVNIGYLPQGVYMLQISNANRKIVHKILKE